MDGFCVELKTVLRLTKYKFILLAYGVIKLVVLPFLLFFSLSPVSLLALCLAALPAEEVKLITQLEICSVVPSYCGLLAQSTLVVLIRLKE